MWALRLLLARFLPVLCFVLVRPRSALPALLLAVCGAVGDLLARSAHGLIDACFNEMGGGVLIRAVCTRDALPFQFG